MTHPQAISMLLHGLRLTLLLEHLLTELLILHIRWMDFQYLFSKRMSPDCHGSGPSVSSHRNYGAKYEMIYLSANILSCLNNFQCSAWSCEYPFSYISSSYPKGILKIMCKSSEMGIGSPEVGAWCTWGNSLRPHVWSREVECGKGWKHTIILTLALILEQRESSGDFSFLFVFLSDLPLL